jgi:hypothetical protein
VVTGVVYINPLNAELNPTCHLPALIGAHPILHISRIKFKISNQAVNSTCRQATIYLFAKIRTFCAVSLCLHPRILSCLITCTTTATRKHNFVLACWLVWTANRMKLNSRSRHTSECSCIVWLSEPRVTRVLKDCLNKRAAKDTALLKSTIRYQSNEDGWYHCRLATNILANDQPDAQIFNTFITILYMFREISCSTSEGQIVSTLILIMWRIGWAPNSIPIYIQQDAKLHSLFISGNCSKCLGWYFHPSSGVHTTVSIASGICHTVTAICRYRGRVGKGLSVLWVAYGLIVTNDVTRPLLCARITCYVTVIM